MCQKSKMLSIMDTTILRIPLYRLFYFDDLSELTEFSGYTDEELELMKVEYSEQILKEIIETVKWATQNSDFDFLSLFPDMEFSNEDMYNYLCKVDKSFKNII